MVLPPEAVEAVAQRAAEIVLGQLRNAQPNQSPWLAGAAAAAAYLGVPRARVYRRLGEIPHHRNGSRLMFRRDELDRWLTTQRER
jgi:excisionase family DNA binding protein